MVQSAQPSPYWSKRETLRVINISSILSRDKRDIARIYSVALCGNQDSVGRLRWSVSLYPIGVNVLGQQSSLSYMGFCILTLFSTGLESTTGLERSSLGMSAGRS